MTIGAKIAALRQQHQMTREVLAEKIDTRPQTIYKYEKDIIKNIPRDKIESICKVFKIEPWDLLNWAPPKSKIITYSHDSLIITIPFVNQKISAGLGEAFLQDDDIEIKTLDILANMIKKSVSKDSLICAEVRGDSMIDANIYSGDVVIFSKGLISGEGIYVLSVCGEVLVKRLEFNPLKNELTIISENKKYQEQVVSAGNENVVILGKVVGWIHSENV